MAKKKKAWRAELLPKVKHPRRLGVQALPTGLYVEFSPKGQPSRVTILLGADVEDLLRYVRRWWDMAAKEEDLLLSRSTLPT
jgi:hypothetical protein